MGVFPSTGRTGHDGAETRSRDGGTGRRSRRPAVFAVVVVLSVLLTAIIVAKARNQNTLTTLLDSPSLVGAATSTIATATTSNSGVNQPPASSPAVAGDTSTSIQASDVAWVDEIVSSTASNAGAWSAQVEVRVVTDRQPDGVAGALVLGMWSGAMLTSEISTTDASGIAEFVLDDMADTSTMFTVLDVIPRDVAYDPTRNLTTSLLVPSLGS